MSGIWLAAAWMGGALLSFMAMAVGGRELSAEIATFEILFLRSVVGLLILAIVILTGRRARELRTRRLGSHVVRNFAHFVGQAGWFYGLAFVPLVEVFAIEFTAPIWTAILAPFLLRERLTPRRFLAIALGFIGVLLLLRPGVRSLDFPTLALLISALGYATSHTLTRRLALEDSALAILFYMTALQLPLGFVLALADWSWPSLAAWPWIVAVGVTALSAHYCVANALRHADAVVVVPLDFLRLPLIAVVGYLFYGEGLSLWVALGAAIILGGNALNLVRWQTPSIPRPDAQLAAPERRGGN